MINPELAIPMHYNTFDLIKCDPQEFIDRIAANGFRGKVMKPGEKLNIP